MTVAQFLNCWKILRSIDRADLGGTAAQLSDTQWEVFRERPEAFMVLSTEAVKDAIWAVVEARS